MPASVAASVAAPQAAVESTARATTAWFRVFLVDGQVLSTLGEFTRVDNDVVLQVPLGPVADGAMPETRSVTIAAASVDWPKTDAYRDAVRRAQFEAAGGERAYAAFTDEVAATLRDVALLQDPIARIRRLEAARARLAQWPSAHHGYRADDVAQALSVVDDLLNGMRAAAGQQAFTLAITSSAGTTPVRPAPTTPLLPPPTLQEVISQALGLAPRVTDPVERMSLLQSAAALLARGQGVDASWARGARTQVRRQIKEEQRVTRSYERLRTWMLERTRRLVAAADVRGLMKVRADLEQRDQRLSRQRPAEMASLLATLDVRLDTARRHRLLMERWSERRPVLERYAALVARHVSGGAALPRALEEIKALAGPAPALLAQAEGQLAGSRADAGLVTVPDEARAVQQLWLSAQQLAARALQGRRSAIRSGDLQQAWEASAAAAGALLLLQQIRTEAAALARPPALPTTGL